MKQQNIQERLEMLAEKIRLADAIVIGGGSGLSSAGVYYSKSKRKEIQNGLQIR